MSKLLDQIEARHAEISKHAGLGKSQRRMLDAMFESVKDVPRLLAAVRAVERLHQRFTIPVITGECAKEECDHEGDCPTIPYDTCQECYRLLEDAYPYFAESGVEAVAYPCPTVLSLTEALEGK